MPKYRFEFIDEPGTDPVILEFANEEAARAEAQRAMAETVMDRVMADTILADYSPRYTMKPVI